MIPHPVVSDREFTDEDPRAWADGNGLGPVWLRMFNGRITWDRAVGQGVTRFLQAVEQMVAGTDVVWGTAYGVKLDGKAVNAGRLHFDAGRRDQGERGQVLRFVGTWSSDGANLNNAFLRRRNHQQEDALVGTTLNTLTPDFIQAPNRYITAFSEGLDLHGRMAMPERPGALGFLVSATMYSPSQKVDLFCPRYESLRYRIPEGVTVLETQVRQDYESA